MDASLDEIVLQSFRVDSESLRNLDSIVRQRCGEIAPTYTLEYDVHRADSLRYTTRDVEELTRERNGVETRIQSVKLVMVGESPDFLKFVVSFKGRVEIKGESSNRANLMILALDVRSIIREQMKGRRAISNAMRLWIALTAFAIGFIGFMAYGTQYSNDFYARSNTSYNRFQEFQDGEIASIDSSLHQVINRYQAAVRDGNTAGQASFLPQAALGELRYDVIISSSLTGLNATPPWWTDSVFIQLAAGLVLGVIVWLVSYLLYPPASAIFLIGDEVRRQARIGQLRDRLIWGLGVTFVLGVASGLVATVILQ